MSHDGLIWAQNLIAFRVTALVPRFIIPFQIVRYEILSRFDN